MSRTARQEIDRATSEDDLLAAITEAATLFGWHWHHVRRSDKAVQMGQPGFPDLVLARKGRVIFAELKSEKGVTTVDQWAWALALSPPRADGEPLRQVIARVWRPSDLDAAIEELR